MRPPRLHHVQSAAGEEQSVTAVTAFLSVDWTVIEGLLQVGGENTRSGHRYSKSRGFFPVSEDAQ